MSTIPPMIENQVCTTVDDRVVRIHTFYGTPPALGYRFTLEPSGPEYEIVSVVPMDARTFRVLAF